MDCCINIISGITLDEERALYGIKDTEVSFCHFEGPADGESALKECHNITVSDCDFSLRYPFWHTENYRILRSVMNEGTRAAVWYAKDGIIDSCKINGVKCLRECDNTTIKNSNIVSPEFGWRCRGVNIFDSNITSEYFLFESSDVKINNLTMKGKYSFQYVENALIENSSFDTKDAFWHSKNMTVKNTVLKGEYLGWYSEGLTLIDCTVIGTQPLCYCKDLTLINCKMEGTDLAFEYSDVNAEIIGEIMSVKNPISGRIIADGYGEIITENSVRELGCVIETRPSRKNTENNLYLEEI